MSEKPPRYKPYEQPAGGWGAAGATAKVLMQQSVICQLGIRRGVHPT